MNKIFNILFFFTITLSFSQSSIDEVLKIRNTQNIPYITVDSLAVKNNYILLDARELEEFNVSHLKNAVCVGYDYFKLNNVTSIIKDKKTPIVVYCSLGVRSEDVAEKLKKAGYFNVYNLFGGIFEWKNHGYPTFDLNETKTEKVHVCSKYWAPYLIKGEKVYE